MITKSGLIINYTNEYKMIIITGSSKGIGKYLFEKYKEKGCEVLGTYNTTVVKNDKQVYKVDITSYSEVFFWIIGIKPLLNQITLINCAGINYNSFAHKLEIYEWEKVIKVNLLGTFAVINFLLPIMREQNYGRIINFSSVTAQIPTPGVSAYAASKAGLWGMTKSLVAENASKGITINNINLGYSNIGMGLELNPEFSEAVKSALPLNQFCPPEDIFNTVEYIINTPYLNGASIDLNGGLI